MDTGLAGKTAANSDEEQATRVVTRELTMLRAYAADELDQEEQTKAEGRFALVVAARMHERRLERLTLDRTILETGGRPQTWTGSRVGLVREQLDQTRQLIGALEPLRYCWVRRPDGMYVRLPGFTGRLNKLHQQLSLLRGA